MSPLDAELILDAIAKLNQRFDESYARMERCFSRALAVLEPRGDAVELCIGSTEQIGETYPIVADNWGGLFDEIPAPDAAFTTVLKDIKAEESLLVESAHQIEKGEEKLQVTPLEEALSKREDGKRALARPPRLLASFFAPATDAALNSELSGTTGKGASIDALDRDSLAQPAREFVVGDVSAPRLPRVRRPRRAAPRRRGRPPWLLVRGRRPRLRARTRLRARPPHGAPRDRLRRLRLRPLPRHRQRLGAPHGFWILRPGRRREGRPPGVRPDFHHHALPPPKPVFPKAFTTCIASVPSATAMPKERARLSISRIPVGAEGLSSSGRVSFRSTFHHDDAPKFRLELSVFEAPALLLAYAVAAHAEAHRLLLNPYQVTASAKAPRLLLSSAFLPKLRGGICSTARPDSPDATVRRAIHVHGDVLLAASEALAEQATKEHFAKSYELVLASRLPRPDVFVKDADSCMYTPTNRSTQVLNGNNYRTNCILHHTIGVPIPDAAGFRVVQFQSVVGSTRTSPYCLSTYTGGWFASQDVPQLINSGSIASIVAASASPSAAVGAQLVFNGMPSRFTKACLES